MFGLDVRVGVGLLVGLVLAVEEGAAEHGLLAALVGDVAPVRALVPVAAAAARALVGRRAPAAAALAPARPLHRHRRRRQHARHHAL